MITYVLILRHSTVKRLNINKLIQHHILYQLERINDHYLDVTNANSVASI